MRRGRVVLALMVCWLIAGLMLCNSSWAYGEFGYRPKWNKEMQQRWIRDIQFDAVKWIKEHDIAPRIKPGLRITPENCKDYDKELRQLLPPLIYDRFVNQAYNSIPEIRVVETNNYYPSKGYMEATERYHSQCKIVNGELRGYVAGRPFPIIDPKDPDVALKVVFNTVQYYESDNCWFNPMLWVNYDSREKVESTKKVFIIVREVKGRVDFPPMPNDPRFEGEEMISTVAIAPQDVRGFAFVRTRFLEGNKQDLMLSYLPSLRRIRRLAGTDAQDPLLGTLVIWDDYKGFWQKISPTIFPYKWKFLGIKECLFPVHADRPFAKTDEHGKIITVWEKVPCWVIEGEQLDKDYVYSKRRLYVNIQTGGLYHTVMYDWKGRVCLTWETTRYILPESGYTTWDIADLTDPINRRRTLLVVDSIPNSKDVREHPERFFGLRALSALAH